MIAIIGLAALILGAWIKLSDSHSLVGPLMMCGGIVLAIVWLAAPV